MEYRLRVANMISEGGLDAMYYGNYQFYNDDHRPEEITNVTQETTQQSHIIPLH